MSPTEFFVSHSINHARAMSMKESSEYLRGFLKLALHTECERPVREALNAVRECDAQLELIASGQLKLPLAETKKGHRK